MAMAPAQGRLDGRTTRDATTDAGLRGVSPTPVLFLCLFASQAALVVLAPILPSVARELGVSMASAAQLRSVSGLCAGVTALLMLPLARRLGLRDLLAVGLTGIAVSSVASALAPSFVVLALAQAGAGASVAVVVSAGTAAARAWASPGSSARVLSWTLSGQPAAWIAGLPVVGLVSGLGWRYAWIAVPFASAVLGVVAVRSRPKDAASPSGGGVRALGRRPVVVGWAIGELFAYAAWTGTLVFSGALLIEAYDAPTDLVGLVLGGAAAAYLPGTFLARRWTGHNGRRALVALALACALGVVVLGAVRPSIWFSVAVFAALVFLAGARTMVASAFGLDAAPDQRVAVMSLRAASLQFGYLLGAAVGGVALAAGGYATLGLALAAMFVLAAVPHVVTGRRSRSAEPGDRRGAVARRRPLPSMGMSRIAMAKVARRRGSALAPLAMALTGALTLQLLVLPGPEAAAGRCPQYSEARVSGQLSDPRLNETSGLVAARSVRRVLWLEEDSGNGPWLYAITPEGDLRAAIEVRRAENRDWEDMAWGAGRLWIGDIGDNARSRSEIQVYWFREPSSLGVDAVRARSFSLRYPDGPHNAEAMLVDDRGKRLFVIEKQTDAELNGVYATSIEGVRRGDTLQLELVARVEGSNITAADLGPDGVMVKTNGTSWFYPSRGGVARTLRGTGPCPLQLPGAETVAFSRSGTRVYTIPEGRDAVISYVTRLGM